MTEWHYAAAFPSDSELAQPRAIVTHAPFLSHAPRALDGVSVTFAQANDGRWSELTLLRDGELNEGVCASFPATCGMIKQIPELFLRAGP